MSIQDLMPEQRNELMQWISLGHSLRKLSKMYGVETTTLWRYRKRLQIGLPIPTHGPGRYPPVPAVIVEVILEELRKDARRGRRAELARRFGLGHGTVSRIASQSGEFPKLPGGRKSRHNKETLRRLLEYFEYPV